MAVKTSQHSFGAWRLRLSLVTVIAAAALWRFPLFHVMPIAEPAVLTGTVDVETVAEKFWSEQLPAAHAADVATVVATLQKDPQAAIKTYAHTVGLGGTAYFFISGEGRVVSRERDSVRLAVGSGADAPVVDLQIGDIFGNTVRDATGLLDVNQFSSLEDFNTLAGALNQRVESRVLPVLRDRAQIGALVTFTGCAEAEEPAPGGPLLTIIPVRAEVH